jgi:hypothetical protein
MNCEQVQARLPEYLENSLNASTVANFEGHMSSCSSCRFEAEILMACIKHVRAFPQVEPPIGFAQRVITHMREIEGKATFWDRWFAPLRTKLALQATALVLISILALQLFQKDQRFERRLLPLEPGTAPNRDSKRSQTAALDEDPVDIRQEETSGARQAVAKGTDETTSEQPAEKSAASSDSTIDSRRKHVAAARTSPPEATFRAGEHDSLSGNVPGRAGPTAPREILSGPSPLVRQLPKPSVRTPLPVAAESQSRSRAPRSTQTLDLFRGASILLPTEIQKFPAFADAELVLRRHRVTTSERGESSGALNAAREQRPLSLEPLIDKIAEITIPQTMWLGIRHSQYEQLKKQLSIVGSIESEYRRRLDDQDSASPADPQLRIMLVVFPPVDSDLAQPIPPGQ